MRGEGAAGGAAVSFRGVDVVFGKRRADALRLIDEGVGLDAIRERTGQVVGVAGATLDVAEGEICVLMGLSGSGKSTLLRCANGLNRPTRGEVTVRAGGEAIEVARCDERSLRRLRTRATAMVFQQFALLPWRTVAENVGLGLELQGVSRQRRLQVVEEKLALVGLSDWKDAYAHQLSGGMQQRVGLARAFALDVPILLMDEPFSALDPLIRVRLQDELLLLQRKLRKTILFVSHDLDEAMKLGNRIAIMEAGRIVQCGTPEDIAVNPADDYVADFIAHMNPVNVLRGASIMTPVEALARCDGRALLAEAETGTTLFLDPAGGAEAAATRGGERMPIVGYEGPGCLDRLPERAVVAAPPDISMREAMEIRRRTGLPVLVRAEGRILGVIGNGELYEGILGRGPADRRH
jgi:glycine betaine/proline transport system ATP-binding protein